MSSGAPPTVLAPLTENRANETTLPNGRVEATGPYVGLISKLPVLSHESITDFPTCVSLKFPIELNGDDESFVTLPITAFERPILKARVMLPTDVPATILVAHLKSKRPKILKGEDDADPIIQALGATRSLIVRAAEAVALRAIVLSIIKDANPGSRGEPLVLLGDLNDDLPAVTTQTICGGEPPHYWPEPEKQKIWDVMLHSVHDIQDAQSYRDVSYTHIYNGRFELLDHIFVSQEFIRQFPKRIAEVRNTRIFNDYIFDERLSSPGMAASAGGGLRPPSVSSDHGVPVTEFSTAAASNP
jgi:hypothetical protein